jgi:hypothetical protein
MYLQDYDDTSPPKFPVTRMANRRRVRWSFLFVDGSLRT